MANHEKKSDQEQESTSMPVPWDTNSYRISDRAADWVDEAIAEISPDEQIAWEVVVLTQSEHGPCVGVFWTARGAVLGSIHGALSAIPITRFSRDAVFQAVRELKETLAQQRSAQLQQAAAQQNGGLVVPH